ncbi:uncharacterized protein LOC114434160 [Parambassis ranga]|uniref:Interleukin-2 receptor subunit beta n=1 Tax=Parambassis ranga TaxID=210632 RepID=A0A6P7I2W7_9TELE|nr:cytokine receptor common subunit beta [Parambassis ranga]XP_028258951.1 cytokine receptor common subunit beta [Parambassis ranga]XP_028258961.1 cytokine receptor common subunit beta [Parambassis ranga]XP_028258970.1 cytokine receptor common subunit beta [Parambassis ranga]XP_028258979.1 cytokine receptor common subunit beta [Parambassis ranga]
MEILLKKTLLLVALLSLLQVCASTCDGCPSLPESNLTCYNDFNKNITCLWDSMYGSDTACTIHAERVDDNRFYTYSSSCELEPIDVSTPAMKKCSMIFDVDYTFEPNHVLAINVTCDGKQIVNITYRPKCHVKLNPPGKPDINFTTVSWSPHVDEFSFIPEYKSDLQWKQQNQQWTEQELHIECQSNCGMDLPEELLIKGERYEARVRGQSINGDICGTWSDWSPTTSWVSPIGTKTKPEPPLDLDFLHIIVAGVAVFALVLAIIAFKSDKTSWVHIVKKIKGQPIPNPANSFLRDVTFKTLSTPHFSTKSFNSFLEPVEIASGEVTFMVDTLTHCTVETKKMKNNQNSANSSFTNPSYSELCTTPVSLLTAGNLEPCATDTPYGPVCGQGEGKKKDQDQNKVTGKDMEIQKMFSKGSSDSVLEISDYEKTEKIQAERLRLQSLDSGICCGEEVSQDSMEADSINLGDEGPECEQGKKGGSGIKVDFQKVFGDSRGTFGVKSIQVCSDYESVQKLQVDSPELPSMDSGVSSGGEEQMSQEEGMDDVDKPTESTCFLFPSHPSITLPCSSLSSPQLPFNISGSGLTAVLRPPPNQILERFALMSACRSVEPSGDGYMPVRQEQS